MRRKTIIGFAILLLFALLVVAVGLYTFFRGGNSNSNEIIFRFLRDPQSRPVLMNTGGVACPGAPFILPSDGLIGLLYADTARPYTNLRRHTGLDIFGDGAPGTVPIYAAYDGYLTRLPEWKSSLIIRHDDPLQAGRTIWTYYTHMASRDGETAYIHEAFSPGTEDVFVEQGTLLGYQGDYAGAGVGVATHLHFSVVLSGDDGDFLNESFLENTLDPSPYLGMKTALHDSPSYPIPCADG